MKLKKDYMPTHDSLKVEGDQQIQLDKHLEGLLGLAVKARAAVRGFEAVRRAAAKNKLALILIDSGVSKNTLKKVSNIATQHRIPAFVVSGSPAEQLLFSITGYKITGIQHGSIASGFLNYLRQENKWP